MPTGLLQRKRDLVREAIAHAAWDLFAAEGYEATTVAEIARRRRPAARFPATSGMTWRGTSDAPPRTCRRFARRPR
jgi:hypothetical protein